MSEDAAKNKNVFEGSNYAANYRKGRSKHPESLIQAILNFSKEKYNGTLELAIDVGCGPGESTDILAPNFKKVIGLDYSQGMIDNAKEHNNFRNVEYDISSAESMPMIANGSVDLVTAGRAIQYFDFPKFFTECKRILKINGIVAFYSSDHLEFIIEKDPAKAKKMNERFRHLREVETGDFWKGQIGIKQRKYVDIEVPFEEKLEIRDSSIFSQSKTSLQDFMNLFKSVPAFVKFAEANGQEAWENLREKFLHDLLDILEVPKDSNLSDIVLDSCYRYFLIMGRKT